MTATEKVTRFAADLIDAATIEGARQSRSAKQQLDHWVRVGRAMEAHATTSWRRIEAALAGELPLSALTREEAAVANAEIDARIEGSLNRGVAIPDLLLAEGRTIVALDEDGVLTEYRPDGTSSPLHEQASLSRSDFVIGA